MISMTHHLAQKNNTADEIFTSQFLLTREEISMTNEHYFDPDTVKRRKYGGMLSSLLK